MFQVVTKWTLPVAAAHAADHMTKTIPTERHYSQQ